MDDEGGQHLAVNVFKLRDCLLEADVLMRYDYAWRSKEFGSKVDRLTGCCLRFLYMAGTWLAPTPAPLYIEWLTNVSTPYPALCSALANASNRMQFTFSETPTEKMPHAMFAYFGPECVGQIESLLTRTLFHNENSSSKGTTILFFLVGDASCLPPCNGDVERRRGLSAFGLGQELLGCMQRRGYKAMAHHVCEFKSTSFTETLGRVMEQFSVPTSNLMCHTEKWEIYAHDNFFLHDEAAITNPSEDEHDFWKLRAKGRTCDNCYEAHHAKLMRCGRCQSAFYCSRLCQKEAWTLHKGECTATATTTKITSQKYENTSKQDAPSTNESN
jgi:hypothetical protein